MNIAIFPIGILRNPKESTHITIHCLAKDLTENGHKVVIITEKAKGLPTQEKIENLLIYRLYKLPILSKVFSHTLALRKIQKELGIEFDLVHAFSATPLFALSGAMAKLFTKAKVIHTLKSYPRSKIGNYCSNYCYPLLNLADKVTIPTNTFANKLKRVNKNKIVLNHSPINLNKFYPQDKKQLKRKFGYQDRKIIFYYGAVWRNKGIDILLKAMPQVIKDNPRVLLLCAPRYNKIEKQQKLVEKLNLPEQVKFLTGDLAIEELVNLADVVALPYKNLLGTEGNPSCLLEAMACKTAVVTTDLPELREIADGCVLMAKANNVNSLAQSLNQALQNTVPTMIDKAYQKALQFDLKKVSHKFIEVYEELLMKN